MKFAYECYADHDVYSFLVANCIPDLRPVHCFGQGEVVHPVLVRWSVSIGMVDEDPDSSHHRARDRASLLVDGTFVQVRELNGHVLAVVKPWLELSFLNSMRECGLKSDLGEDAKLIRLFLSTERGEKHAVFRRELKQLYEVSLSKGIASLPVELRRACTSARP